MKSDLRCRIIIRPISISNTRFVREFRGRCLYNRTENQRVSLMRVCGAPAGQLSDK